MKELQLQRERGETEIFLPMVHSPQKTPLASIGLGALKKKKARSLELCQVYHVDAGAQVPGVSPTAFPRHVSRKPDHKWRSQDTNQNSHRILVWLIVPLTYYITKPNFITSSKVLLINTSLCH